MEWRAAFCTRMSIFRTKNRHPCFCIAPPKRWYDSSTLMLLTGISGIERFVARV